MAILQWLTRCIPGLSTLLLLALLEHSLGVVRFTFRSLRDPHPAPIPHDAQPVWSQGAFALYTLFLHLLAFAFPLRLSWAVWSATHQIHSAHTELRLSHEKNTFSEPHKNDGKDGTSEGEALVEPHKVTMVAIIPSYKETLETMQDTLRVLANHRNARDSYDVFLAMEERDPNAVQTAQQLIRTFFDSFLAIQFTVHPAGIPGEGAGKSSNVSWAAKEVERKYADQPNWKDVLVTVMDSDTHLLEQYFHLLRQRHIVNRQRDDLASMILYVPPIVFDRNAHHVPRLVRMADLMWCGAGLSCYQGKSSPSTVAIPTAVYTISLPLMRLVNGWDAGPGAIGEDLHMFLRCYMGTNGLLSIESIASPASHCNVTTGLPGIRGWVANHIARYSQGLRHMWGCLDTGYGVTQWLKMNPKPQKEEQKSSDAANLQNLLPRRSRKLSHTDLSLRLSQYALYGSKPRRFTLRNATVFIRLFEAHFLPTHLLLVLLASAIYTSLPPPFRQTELLNMVLDITAYLRGLSFAAMTIYFAVFYEEYHRVCISARMWEMQKSGMYNEMQGDFSHRHRWCLGTILDYVTFPIAGTIFGSVALLQAAFSHFFTENLVYLVSAKPVRAIVDKAGLHSLNV